MVGDLRSRIESARNKVEEMAKGLPGYKGYKDKEVRREADKMLRMKVGQGLEAQRKRLNNVQLQLTNAGRLGVLLTLDRSQMRLQLLIDRIKTASYGYAGLFDAIKVKETELDALYTFDAALMDNVEQVKGLVDAVAAAEKDDDVTKAGNALLAALEGIGETFSKRQDVILENPTAV